MHRSFIVTAILALALLTGVTTTASAAPLPRPVTTTTVQQIPGGLSVTTTTWTMTNRESMIDGGGGGGAIGCADISRSANDYATATTVTAFMHVCVGGGRITYMAAGASANPGCCEPLIHWVGYDSQGSYNDGFTARSYVTGHVDARAYAVFGFVTYYVGRPSASISVNGYGTIS